MKKRVLIIDDDPRNIFALAATLRAKQYDVTSCSSAAEALKKLESDKDFDAVLIDMMMPEMDGYEAIPLIKKMTAGRRIPVLAVTAQAMVGDRERCLASGADHYVAKPIDVDRLMSLLQAT